MKKVASLVFLLLIVGLWRVYATNPPKAEAQDKLGLSYRNFLLHDNRWEAGFSLGMAYAMTDLAPSTANSQPSLLDVNYQGISPGLSAYARYRMSPALGFRGNINGIMLRGDDAWSSNQQVVSRGKSFSNLLLETTFLGEFYLPKNHYRSKNTFSDNFVDFYLFTGISAFYHSPELSGPVIDDYDARLLAREDLYENFQFAIPIGAGVQWTINHRWIIGMDLNFRYTFFDFLDGMTRPYSTRNDHFLTTNLNLGYVLTPPPYATGKTIRKNVFRKRPYSKGFLHRKLGNTRQPGQ
jgi:hypothetical protein